MKNMKTKNARTDNGNNKKSFRVMNIDETFHDLSRSYKFDEISMQKMVDRAEKNAERQRKKRIDAESGNILHYNPYLTFKDILHFLKKMFVHNRL